MTEPRYPTTFDPEKPRKGESIGGGYLVIRRGKKTRRVSVKTTLPYEHPDLESAEREVVRLQSEHPGEHFQVWEQVV